MHKAQVFGYLLIAFLVGIFIGPWFGNVTLATVVFVLIGTIVITVSAYEKTFAKSKKAQRNRQIGVVIGGCILVLANFFSYAETVITIVPIKTKTTVAS